MDRKRGDASLKTLVISAAASADHRDNTYQESFEVLRNSHSRWKRPNIHILDCSSNGRDITLTNPASPLFGPGVT